MAKSGCIQRGAKRKGRKTLFVEGFPKNPYEALWETRKMIREEQFESLRKVIRGCSHFNIEFKYGDLEAEFSMYSHRQIFLTLTKNSEKTEQTSQYSFSVNAFGVTARKEEEYFLS